MAMYTLNTEIVRKPFLYDNISLPMDAPKYSILFCNQLASSHTSIIIKKCCMLFNGDWPSIIIVNTKILSNSYINEY